jgi:hypothetical protein
MTRKHRNVSLDILKDECKHKRIITAEVLCDDASLEIPNSVEELATNVNFDLAALTRNIALFCLKLKTIYCIPDKTVQCIMDDFSQTFEVSTSYFKGKIRDVTVKHNLYSEVLNDLNSCERVIHRGCRSHGRHACSCQNVDINLSFK